MNSRGDNLNKPVGPRRAVCAAIDRYEGFCCVYRGGIKRRLKDEMFKTG